VRGQGRLEVVLTGGGTGGHIEPALALARALERSGRERAALHFVGARRGMEGKAIGDAGFSISLLPGRGVRRRLAWSNVPALCGLALALLEACALLLRHRPRVVVTFGGYAGLPSSLAAVLLRIPLLVVNLDAIPGGANRLVARFAARTAMAFPAPLPRGVLTGAPLREAVLAAAAEEPSAARARLELPEGRAVLVVVGGSLGAGRLNEAALGLARRFAARDDLVLVHVCGARNYDEVAAERDALGIATGGGAGLDYRLLAFAAELPELFRAAALVVSRAGAMTVAELAAIGAPSLLVPLPNAPGDHQRRNTAELVRAGGALVVDDAEVTAEHLEALLGPLLAEPGRLEEMARAARSVGRLDATSRVVALIDELAKAAA